MTNKNFKKGPDVDDKDQSIIIFDFIHGGFSSQGVLDDVILVQFGRVNRVNRLPRVLAKWMVNNFIRI